MVEAGANGPDFSVLYQRRDDLDLQGLTIGVQFSHDMVTWFPGEPGAVVAAGPGIEAVKVPYPYFLPNGRKARFWQVVASASAP